MKFRKKPVVIEAVQYAGNNVKEIETFIGKSLRMAYASDDVKYLYINTLEGEMQVDPMDWVIKGVKGEFYPCKPDIFEATYEKC